jgi:hypothetical protein
MQRRQVRAPLIAGSGEGSNRSVPRGRNRPVPRGRMGEECEGTDRYLEEGEGEEAGESYIGGQGVAPVIKGREGGEGTKQP